METRQLTLQRLNEVRNEVSRFMLTYKFALKEVETKVNILSEEFQMLHDYNPIEHVKSRLKTPESIWKKVQRKGIVDYSLSEIKEKIRDIAGIRITCSFISDIYRVKDMLIRQRDLKVLSIKDYIANPKPNGYKSLHLVVEVPVFMSDAEEHVCVEIQIRTIAMDFWASLEHKIFYKYNRSIPSRLTDELKASADAAYQLDLKMEQLQHEIEEIKSTHPDDEQWVFPSELLELIYKSEI